MPLRDGTRKCACRAKAIRSRAGEIATIKAWIDAGAEWPDSASVKLETKDGSLGLQAAGETEGAPRRARIRLMRSFKNGSQKEGLKPAPKAAPGEAGASAVSRSHRPAAESQTEEIGKNDPASSIQI
jgi:hypothetical protein